MTLSIITPSFNQGKFIERTIQSVLSQLSDKSLEYVVADGGSTDETLSILKKYSSQLTFVSEKDKGQTDAVNKAINMTSGDIIGWLNSDDIYYPNAFATVQKYFDNYPEIDVIYGKANHIDADDKILEHYYTEEWDSERLKEICYLCQPAVFFRRSVITRFGLLNDQLQYCMDYEFWLRLSKAGAKFLYVDAVLAGSRLHEDTKTLGSRVKVHSEINEMLLEKFGKVPDRWLSNYAFALVESNSNYKQSSPARLKINLTAQTLFAALRWNKKISKSHLKLTFQMLKSFFTTLLRKS